MEPFRRIEAVAAPLPFANIDTDQIIPARFMQTPRSAGYGGFLLRDMREASARGGRPLSIDDPARAGARILVARRNFGSGSSREAAVYALADFGIACVIAPSFGDIFSSNAVNNGLLPARVTEEDAERLIALLEGGETRAAVDLETMTISCGGAETAFQIDPIWRVKLLNGWDDLDLTMSRSGEIAEFVAADRLRRPWAQPRRPAG